MQRKKLAFFVVSVCASLMATAQMQFHSPLNDAPPAYTVKNITLPSGVHLNYAEQGDADGEPVIFLHGYTDSWHSFQDVLSFLPPSIHAFSVSLRGHGNSGKPEGHYAPSDFAADIREFSKKLNVGPAVIVGHSMGAIVAQQFALEYPHLTKAMVLIGAFASFADKPAMVEFSAAINQLTDPVDSAFIFEFQKSTLSKGIAAEKMNMYVAESMKVPAHVWQSVSNEMMSAKIFNQLQRLSVPTLIVWGDADILTLQADQDRLLTQIKNSRLIIYEHTGHAVHWEEPVRVANDLVNFIDKNL